MKTIFQFINLFLHLSQWHQSDALTRDAVTQQIKTTINFDEKTLEHAEQGLNFKHGRS